MSERCNATTNQGYRCRLLAKYGEYCLLHRAPGQEPQVERPKPVRLHMSEVEVDADGFITADVGPLYTAPPEPTDRMRGALYKIERMTRDFPGGDRRLKKMGDIARTALATTEE